MENKLDMLNNKQDVMVIDSTKLKAYQACPKRFMFEYVWGLVYDEPSIHLVFGTAWHEAMEHLLLTSYSVDEVEKAFEKFMAVWGQYPYLNDYKAAKSQENALTALYEYCVNFRYDSFTVKSTEIAGEIPISLEPFKKMAFKIDAIIEKGDNIYVLEHKTASRSGYEDSHRIGTQIGLYSHVLQSLYDNMGGVIINQAIFYKPGTKAAKDRGYTNEFMRIPINLTKFQLGRWLDTANFYYDAIIKDLVKFQTNLMVGYDSYLCFVQNPSACFNYNSRCPYFDFCYSWSDYASRYGQEQIGFTKRVWNPLTEYADAVEKFNKERTNMVQSKGEKVR